MKLVAWFIFCFGIIIIVQGAYNIFHNFSGESQFPLQNSFEDSGTTPAAIGKLIGGLLMLFFGLFVFRKTNKMNYK